jgi:bacteriocin biosynthesis cyclodehydratase domain-containing protein
LATRPRLKPYYRPIRRGSGTVQLGLSAESGGILLSGLAPSEVALLERLDGTFQERDLHAMAAAFGVDRRRADELLKVLREHRVLVTDAIDRADLVRLSPMEPDRAVDDANVLGLAHRDVADPVNRVLARAWQQVVIDGSGRLAEAIGALLRSSGVGRVDLGPWAGDVADAELRGQGNERPDIVILVTHPAVDPRTAEPWRRRGIPLLPVVPDGNRVVVGPLLGPDPALPCLRCLQLTRADHDAGWAEVMAQAVGSEVEAASESALVSVAAGVAAMVAHASLAGDPVPAGVSVEVGLPWPRLDHRRWARHPSCPGHTGEGALGSASTGPAQKAAEPG